MAWSDAAREASIEARRATAKTKAMPSVKSHPEGREGKIKDHKDAMKAHQAAAALNRSEGNDTAADHHDKMAAIHQEKAGSHEEKQSLGLQRQTLTVQKEMGREAKLRGEKPEKEDLTPGKFQGFKNTISKDQAESSAKLAASHSRFASGKEADQLHQDRTTQREKDDSARAAAATAHATKMTDEATTFRDGASHERAYAAHMAAAGANKVAGNKELVKAHEKMADRHEALEKSYKGGKVVESAQDRSAHRSEMEKDAAGKDPNDGASPATSRAEIKSAVASKASASARRNEDPQKSPGLHIKAAEAHSTAATAHMDAGNKTGAEHHAKMEEQHRDAADRAKSMNFKSGPGRDRLKYR